MTSTSPSQSLTNYFLDQTFNNLVIDDLNDSKIKKCAKCVAGLTIYSSLTILGVVESIARFTFFIILKTVQFFVPKEYSDTLNKDFFYPAGNYMRWTFEATLIAAANIVTQFMGRESQNKIYDKINNFTIGNYYYDKFLDLHINGFEIA